MIEKIAKQENRPPIVVAYGGGTDSTAMILACHEKGIPIDSIIFADTGGERPSTYKFIEIFNVWLKNNGYNEIVVVKAKNNLYDTMIKRQTIPSVAFGGKTCSIEFKQKPWNKFIKQWEPAKQAWLQGQKVIKLVGFDASESRRAKQFENELFQNSYPLIEWQIDRFLCTEIIKKHGLPQPGKSACFFCPMHRKNDVLKLNQEYPELMQKALMMEQNMKITGNTIGLGRGYKWKELIEENERTMKLATLFDEAMPCGCYDGD